MKNYTQKTENKKINFDNIRYTIYTFCVLEITIIAKEFYDGFFFNKAKKRKLFS